ncbi:glycosyltransferase [Mangrovimonas sp. YM274]|uniref:glycosyltransferase n=1 Tax=Mangrovimonas sp. YM274 TaxID=3070660 RepID=UPI0027DE09CA|nr:glycosyltransferase [Mangrovimonas sp. YM274]WMI69843.1 glycosyltransferase [Mangrovimonas sp. YM274]
MNIAIFSPNNNTYSETFIQAHKELLKGNIYYYHGQFPNLELNQKSLVNNSSRIWFLRVYRKLTRKSFSYLYNQVIVRSLKRNKIDVVLVEYGSYAYQLISVLKLVKIPFVVHFHGFDASVKSVIASCGNYSEVFMHAEKIIVVSKVMLQALINLGCPENKLVYTPCGPQGEFYEVNPKFFKKQFVSVGRFTDKKAPYYTILAFKKVLEKHPDATMVMAGEGMLFNVCKNLVKLLSLENNVKLVGVITSDQFRKLLEESLAFVQHSITADNGDMEGTPVTILEASASGLPIISTYHGGISDVIQHTATGLLSKEHDVDQMSNNMIMLLEDMDYAKGLGLAGKKRIKAHFSLEKHISILQETLESVQ